MGIIPGETSALKTKELLSSSIYVKTESIYGSGMIPSQWYPVSYSFNWKFTHGGRGGVWTTGESKVVFIEIDDPKLNLSQFIKIYGKPSVLLIIPYWGLKTHVYLVFSELGMIVDVNETISKSNHVTVRSSNQIDSITYVDKVLLIKFIQNFISRSVPEEDIDEKLREISQPWSGYGKYETINFWQ